MTPDGQYEFLKVPFGLCNSPSVFQRFVNTIFHDLIRANVVIVYLDDLIVASTTEEDNLDKVKRVFEVARENGLVLRFDKCQFMQTKVNFLGHVLCNGTVSPSE